MASSKKSDSYVYKHEMKFYVYEKNVAKFHQIYRLIYEIELRKQLLYNYISFNQKYLDTTLCSL